MKLRIAWVPLLVGLFGCGASGPPASAMKVVNVDQKVGVGDVFEVRVQGEEDLSGTYRVASDGKVDFPFVGMVEVDNLDPPAIALLLKDRLKTGGFLVDPHVNVFVTEYTSKRVTVSGAVQKPGNFPITPGMTVTEVITQAGGMTALSNENDTVVTRTENGKLRRFRIRANDIARGRASDFPLQAGDKVFVPRRAW